MVIPSSSEKESEKRLPAFPTKYIENRAHSRRILKIWKPIPNLQLFRKLFQQICDILLMKSRHGDSRTYRVCQTEQPVKSLSKLKRFGVSSFEFLVFNYELSI